MIQILKIIICSCNELTQHPCALFVSPNENKFIKKYLWHQQRKNLDHIFQQHIRPNCNIILFECSKTKMLNFNSYFVNVNIAPLHMMIPLQNNTLWKVTHHTIHIENQQFFGGKRI
jgi:hypothetical protein